MLSNAFPVKSEKYPVISIVGPTGVGKTEVSWQLAEMLAAPEQISGCDLISVDSKQVYKDIEILSGADIPLVSKREHDDRGYPIFRQGKNVVHGVAILGADQSWSVAQFQDFAIPIIERAQLSQRKVILVGGTGLYHERLWETDPQLRVPRNDELRTELEVLSVEQLQQRLVEIEPNRFEQMNHSDQLNPRRLHRAIEVSLHQVSKTESNSLTTFPVTQYYLGLIAPDDVIKEKIRVRVSQRFKQGAVKEVQELLQKPDINEQVTVAIGFSQLQQYLENTISQDECLKLWAQAEWQYVTRQLTWWRKKNIQWVDVHEQNVKAKLENFLQSYKIIEQQ